MIELNIDSFLGGKSVRNLSGHERGVVARQFYGLDELDVAAEPVLFIIPAEVDAIASSFFQGMFSKSVRGFSSDDEFLTHYKFQANPTVYRQIEQGLRRIRTKRGSAFAH